MRKRLRRNIDAHEMIRRSRIAYHENMSLVPKEDIETEPTLNEMFQKVSVLLDCPTVSSEEFIAVDDDMCIQPQLWQPQHDLNVTDVYKRLAQLKR
ncbi:hypothetical protein TNCV_735571 [Trichonephila clavipes]|uniref:Uncharacterized protein n=1 Tax=Trichonephila clavipes TaxID=2585209 RepID=A0A8X6SRW8_TRICX|nr:hypothetical protein TNCV_735571 [Trichonephila clavipes]